MKMLLTECAGLILLLTSFSATAQESALSFALPDAQIGTAYKADVQSILSDKYGLRIERSSESARVQWSFAGGELPKGLAVAPAGVIIGTPEDSRERQFQFELRATETTSSGNGINLTFLLSVKRNGLRLTKIGLKDEGLKLVRIENAPTPSDDKRSSADSAGSSTAATGGTSTSPRIEWNSPQTSNEDFTEAEKTFEVKVSDKDKTICLLNVVVQGHEKQVLLQRRIKVDYNHDVQRFTLPLAKGENTISVSAWMKDPKKDCTEESELTSLTAVSSNPSPLTINCPRGECGEALKAAALEKKSEELSPFSGINTRALLGIEQSGASSAASEHTPFLDFFFNTPMGRKNSTENPRFSIWGDVRLTSTPQQTAAFVSSSGNLPGAIKDNQINDIATSFDFKFGPEFQFNPNDRNRISLIAGFGAISPLTEPTSAATIFSVPAMSASQAANFFSDYPEAKNAQYIAFVRPERDRFMRQYFGGLRFKSYHYDRNGNIENRFPSMFDVTFGQNAAVTGGRLHKFVMSFDGSYQLPLKTGLFIFGSANIKVGGDKSIRTPYVLKPAPETVKLTDDGVMITSRQLNRDVYRIGFGVDLVELFKDKSGEKAPKQ
jgi:hypothetical protein